MSNFDEAKAKDTADMMNENSALEELGYHFDTMRVFGSTRWIVVAWYGGTYLRPFHTLQHAFEWVSRIA